MKHRFGKSQFKKYRDYRIYQTVSEDRLFALAEELVHAKDVRGVDLFWDSDEEEFMRNFLKVSEVSTC